MVAATHETSGETGAVPMHSMGTVTESLAALIGADTAMITTARMATLRRRPDSLKAAGGIPLCVFSFDQPAGASPIRL